MAAILVIAAFVRMDGLSAGLPSMHDPDEPIFILHALRLLKERTLDPQWYGHPGTQTIYSLALLYALQVAGALATGAFASVQAFAQAILLDPSMAAIPARLFIVACALATIVLAQQIGQRLYDLPTGLLAALFLALSPLHVRWSAIVRTDIHSGVFMLLSVLAAIGIIRDGRARYYLLAGIAAGFACATKWPAAAVIVGPAAAGIARLTASAPTDRRRAVTGLLLLGAGMFAGLFVASPYLFLNYAEVLNDLRSEAKPQHLGSNGGSWFFNLGWYLEYSFAAAFGWAGLSLAGLGLIAAVRRNRPAVIVLLPIIMLFVGMLSRQHMVWERWMLPILPLVAILEAAGAVWLWRLLQRSRVNAHARTAIASAGLIGLLAPMALQVTADATERKHDTRDLASAWLRDHVPPGSSVVVEHFAFDLLPQNWKILFPAGRHGCIDARAVLQGKLSPEQVRGLQSGRTIVVLGTIDPRQIAHCWGDYAVISYYDRYRAEGHRYPAELDIYHQFLSNGRTVKTFAPQQGRIGGPVVRIVHLASQPPADAITSIARHGNR